MMTSSHNIIQNSFNYFQVRAGSLKDVKLNLSDLGRSHALKQFDSKQCSLKLAPKFVIISDVDHAVHECPISVFSEDLEGS